MAEANSAEVLKSCTNIGMVRSRGLFLGTKSLFEYSVPISLLQMSLSSLFILALSRILKPLGQYSFAPQIAGGIFLGSTIMGRVGRYTQQLFPARSLTILDTFALFGCTFYFFLIGVKTDIWMLTRTRKKDVLIGFAAFGMGLLLSVPASMATERLVKNNPNAPSLFNIAISGSFISFPVISHYLNEFRMVNSEFGQVALSASVFSYILGFVGLLIISVATHRPGHVPDTDKAMICGVSMAVFILFLVRPLIQWSLKQQPEGEALKPNYIYTVLLGVLLTGFVSQILGMEIYFGPLIYGLAIPSGPPLGSAIVEKVELINMWLLMPLFFVKVGLIVDLGALTFKEFFTVHCTILSAWVGKFVGASSCSLFFGVSLKDSISLGLVFCVQGVLEVGLFKIFLDNNAIDQNGFTTMCTSLLILSAIATPIIKYLQDPSRRYALSHNQTILHLDRNSELRMLICAHDQEDITTTLKFLEAINPTKRSPLALYALHLVEHIGTAQPLLIPHKLTKVPSSKATTSKSIVNALRYFEDMYHGVVSVKVFTAISTYANMHDEICTMAFTKKVSLIIIPFHKRFAAVGLLEAFKKGIRKMNSKILGMAPCSVGVIVDREILGNPRPKLETLNSYSVGVLFLGGADDREALAIGARMVGQPSIKLTVVSLIPHPCIGGLGDSIGRKLDDQSLYDFRLEHGNNEKVTYIEEIVKDGTGTAAAMRSIEETQELVIVGRRHGKESPLLMGLVDWGEETELGALGDALVSPDFRGNASILVVQQHTCTKDVDFDILETDKYDEVVEDKPKRVPMFESSLVNI